MIFQSLISLYERLDKVDEMPLFGFSVEDIGFNILFPIQAQAMMPLLKGRDVIGQARTGTGKTAAFGIPMVEHLDSENDCVQGQSWYRHVNWLCRLQIT